jgi:hypothetical protein
MSFYKFQSRAEAEAERAELEASGKLCAWPDRCSLRYLKDADEMANAVQNPPNSPLGRHRGEQWAADLKKLGCYAAYRIPREIADERLPGMSDVTTTPFQGEAADDADAQEVARKEEVARRAVIAEREEKRASRDRYLHEISPTIRVLKINRAAGAPDFGPCVL